MFTELLTIIALLASPNDRPVEPPPSIVEDQHFCCDTTDDGKGQGGGEGCVTIPKSHVDSCSAVLYCKGNWRKQDGTVTCY
ncbi:MAG TPA: hypothetical protein VM869_19370 [Enhygromyxa sp.]|nr:hypothetical protein [Enhygromyxa sp.]